MVKGEVEYLIFDGCYTISKEGEIWSRYNETEEHIGSRIKEKIDKDGYPVVNLTVRGIRTTPAVHRLLALKFIPNPENKPQVNHKDGNKLNNALTNLEWATGKENMQHAMDNGLCKPYFQPREIINTITGQRYPSIKKAAADLNISYSNCKKYLLGLVKNKTSLQYVSISSNASSIF